MTAITLLLLAGLAHKGADPVPLEPPPKKEKEEWRVGPRPNEPSSTPSTGPSVALADSPWRPWLVAIKVGTAIELTAPLASGPRGAVQAGYRWRLGRTLVGAGLELSVGGLFSRTSAAFDAATRGAGLAITPLVSVEHAVGPGTARLSAGPRLSFTWLDWADAGGNHGARTSASLGGMLAVGYGLAVDRGALGPELVYWAGPYRVDTSSRPGHTLALSLVYSTSF